MNTCSRCHIFYFPRGQKLTEYDPQLKRHVNRYIAQRNYNNMTTKLSKLFSQVASKTWCTTTRVNNILPLCYSKYLD